MLFHSLVSVDRRLTHYSGDNGPLLMVHLITVAWCFSEDWLRIKHIPECQHLHTTPSVFRYQSSALPSVVYVVYAFSTPACLQVPAFYTRSHQKVLFFPHQSTASAPASFWFGLLLLFAAPFIKLLSDSLQITHSTLDVGFLKWLVIKSKTCLQLLPFLKMNNKISIVWAEQTFTNKCNLSLLFV